MEKCLDNPPLPGADGTDKITVEVTQELRVADCKNSQLAVVKVTDRPPQLPLRRGDGREVL